MEKLNWKKMGYLVLLCSMVGIMCFAVLAGGITFLITGQKLDGEPNILLHTVPFVFSTLIAVSVLNRALGGKNMAGTATVAIVITICCCLVSGASSISAGVWMRNALAGIAGAAAALLLPNSKKGTKRRNR